jgi:hypothetical protein
MRSRAVLCGLFGILVCFACSRGGGEARGGGQAPRPRSTGLYEDAFRLGGAASADGTVTMEKHVFNQGEHIYVSFVAQNAPAGAKARAVWTSLTKGNAKLAEEEKPLQKNGFVAFDVADTSRWEPGDYRLLKILIDPAKPGVQTTLGSADFKIVPR